MSEREREGTVHRSGGGDGAGGEGGGGRKRGKREESVRGGRRGERGRTVFTPLDDHAKKNQKNRDATRQSRKRSQRADAHTDMQDDYSWWY